MVRVLSSLNYLRYKSAVISYIKSLLKAVMMLNPIGKIYESHKWDYIYLPYVDKQKK